MLDCLLLTQTTDKLGNAQIGIDQRLGRKNRIYNQVKRVEKNEFPHTTAGSTRIQIPPTTKALRLGVEKRARKALYPEPNSDCRPDR
jgi:hypothetical protein